MANSKFASAEQFDLVDELVEAGVVKKEFNLDFILGADASDQRPSIRDWCGDGWFFLFNGGSFIFVTSSGSRCLNLS